VRETEAEAVALVVCQSVGLDIGTASADYIQLWHGDAKLLQESLEVVQCTAAIIFGGFAPEEGWSSNFPAICHPTEICSSDCSFQLSWERTSNVESEPIGCAGF
jgi:hypothetical protein